MNMDENQNDKSDLERKEAIRGCCDAKYKILNLVEKVKDIIECTDVGQNTRAQLNLIISAGILTSEVQDELEEYMIKQIKYFKLKKREEEKKD